MDRLRVTAVALVAAVVAAVVAVPAVAAAANDPYRSQQWALDRIGAEEAWRTARGAGVVVAVVDTGVELAHPDLRDRLVRDADGGVLGVDLIDGGTPRDEHGHGTLVAGIIAAATDNAEGIAGVAPAAGIMPIRALDRRGAGTGSDVDRAIRWAVDHGADVVNLSLESVKGAGGRSTGPGAPTSAVRYAWERGVPVVAAAGNGGAATTDYPSSSPIVLVGATDAGDRRAAFSSAGRVDGLVAPGVDIISTWCRLPGGGGCDGRTHTYGIAEGTSFAAPHVTGALALLMSSGLTGPQAVDRLRATAVDLGPPGPDPEHGYGRIDVAAAMSARTTAAAAPPPSPTASPSPVRASPSSEARTPAPEPSPAPTATTEPSPAPSAATPVEPAPETTSPEPTSPEPAADGAALSPDVVPIADVEPWPPPPATSDTGDVSDADGPAGPDEHPAQPEIVSLPVTPASTTGAVALRLLAAGLVGSSLAAWSAVARRTP